MRLAWFSPLPPTESGIAAYTADVVPRLAASHVIDCFDEHEHWLVYISSNAIA